MSARVPVVGACAAMFLLLLPGCTSSGSGGACAETTIELTSTTLTAGQEFRVSVDNLYERCNDTNGGVLEPAKDVPVSLSLQDGSEVRLGTMSADEGRRAEATFQLPEGTAVGPAELTVGSTTDYESAQASIAVQVME